MADAAGITSLASGLSQARVQSEVQTSVARKALDIQESTAQQLVDALPDASGAAPAGSPVNPGDRVGAHVDTSA